MITTYSIQLFLYFKITYLMSENIGNTFLPSNCLFLNDLSLKIYLGKINQTFSKNLDFTMLPRIETKTNLIES